MVAEADGMRHEAIADGAGHYELRGLATGRYNVEVLKTGYVAGPSPDRGTVLLSKNSCAVWDLGMWPNGKIAGTIRAHDRRAMGGVTVQAFGPRQTRFAISGPDGRYILDRLPEGDYTIGVNAVPNDDVGPYPATLYSNRVHVAELATVGGIDLVLPLKRVATKLQVNAVGPDGTPYRGAVVTVDNTARERRGRSFEELHKQGQTNRDALNLRSILVRSTSSRPLTLTRTELGSPLEGTARLHIGHQTVAFHHNSPCS